MRRQHRSARSIAGNSTRTERSLGRMRSSRNFNIGPSPAFASSIALRTSSTSSPLSRASATNVVLFLEPGLRPPLPFSKGRPRTGEFDWGLGDDRPLGSGFATLISHSTRYATLTICWVLHEVLQIARIIIIGHMFICLYVYFADRHSGPPRAKPAYLRKGRHGLRPMRMMD